MTDKRKTMSDRIRAFDIGTSTADVLAKGIDKLPVSADTQTTLKTKASPVVAGAAAGAATFAAAAVDAGTRAYDATKVGARAAKPGAKPSLEAVPDDEPVLPTSDAAVPDALERLVKLHEAGILDDQEFAAAKKQTLGL